MGTVTPEFLLCPSAKEMTTVFGGSAREFLGHDPWLAKANYAGCFGANTYLDSCPVVRNAGKRTVGIDYQADKARQPHRGSFKSLWSEVGKKLSRMTTLIGRERSGKLAFGQGTTMRQIRDGASHTLAVSEVVGYDSEKDPRGAWTIHVRGLRCLRRG